jgi:hypothetical protein
MRIDKLIQYIYNRAYLKQGFFCRIGWHQYPLRNFNDKTRICEHCKCEQYWFPEGWIEEIQLID